MSIFDLIKKLYIKKPITYQEITHLEVKDCIVMINLLTQDPDNLEILKKAIAYLFNISPVCFYMYLYCQIKQRKQCPFLKIPKRTESNNNEMFQKLKFIMGWGERESQENRKFLENIINFDREHFEEKLGIEKKD